MKQLILIVFTLVLIGFNSVYAAELRLNISSSIKNNPYYLCIYGEGCLRISNKSKTFPLAPINMGNIRKFAVTDMTNMRMVTQDSNDSCRFQVESNHKVTISGRLIVKNSRPYITNLRCQVG